MRYLYFLLLYEICASATSCAIDNNGNARCFSFAETEKLFSRADEIANLEVECLSGQNTTFSIPFPNLNALSIHNCGEATSDLRMPFHTIRSLNLSNNGITNLRWQRFQGSASDVVDLRQNPLSCSECTNLWIWEHQRRLTKTSGWDLHFIVGLPRQILTDEEFLRCNFSHCPHEEVRAQTLTKALQIGDSITVNCDVSGLNESLVEERMNETSSLNQFIWPFRDAVAADNSSTTFLQDSNSTKISLQIDSLSSQELGYVACVCQQCLYRPAFDVLEVCPPFSSDFTPQTFSYISRQISRYPSTKMNEIRI